MKRVFLASLLFVLSSMTISAEPIEIIRSGFGWKCVQVIGGEDVLISRHRQQHKAEQCVINETLRNPKGEYEAVPTGRIRVEITPATAASLYPIQEDGNAEQGEDPPAGWTASLIQGTTHPVQADSHSYVSGEFQVTSEGGRIIGNEDSFPSWMYTTDTTSDYTISVCVQDFTQLSELPDKARAGLMLRESAAVGSRMHFINLIGLEGLLINERFATDAIQIKTDIDRTFIPVPYGFRMEVDRAEDSLKMYTRTGCTGSWVEQDQEIQTWFGSGNTLYFHLPTAPQDINNDGLFSFSKYDSVSVSTANVDHGGAGSSTVALSASTYSQSEETTPLVVTVGRTGSGSGACSIDYSLSDVTAVAGTDYTDTSGTLSWSDTETGDKTFNVTIIDRDGTSQGNLTFDVDIAANTCSDTITTNAALVTILDQDSVAGAWTTHGTPSYTPIVKDFPCGDACDWDTYLATNPTYEVCYVTNLNTSGAGSITDCMEKGTSETTLRLVVPTVSGVVEFPENSSITMNNPGVLYAGGAEPDPGLCFKDVQLTIKDDLIHVQHWCQWNALGNREGGQAGTGININNNPASEIISQIVLLNIGASWNVDGAINVFDNVDDLAVLQSFLVQPTGEVTPPATSPTNNEEQWNAGQETVGSVFYARNFLAHGQGRNPKYNGPDNINQVNNVIYNWANNVTAFTKGDAGDSQDANIIGDLFVPGPDSGTSDFPVSCTSGTFADVYMSGNRMYQGRADTDQSNLFNNSANCTFSDSTPQATQIGSYNAETIGASDSAKRDFAVLVTAHGGPRPASRLNWFQQPVTELLSYMDTDSGGGSIANSLLPSTHPLGAFPTLAENSCDPTVADDCGTGKIALDETDLDGTSCGADCSHIDHTFTFLNSVHCAVMPAGATGC